MDPDALRPISIPVNAHSGTADHAVFEFDYFLEQCILHSHSELHIYSGLPSEGHPRMCDHCIPVLASVQKGRER